MQPLLVMMKNLGIANSIAALIPPYLAFGMPFQIFVMRGFFRLLPTELIEAARVDGASNATIFLRIMLPLSLPPLATLAIIDTLATWNEFLIALVLISGQTSRTVPVGLLQFQGEFISQYTLLMAGVLISILPVLVIFIFLQRYFVAGLTGGREGLRHIRETERTGMAELHQETRRGVVLHHLPRLREPLRRRGARRRLHRALGPGPRSCPPSTTATASGGSASTPARPGVGQAQLSSRPANPDFGKAFDFEVADADAPGFLRATPGDAWGFRFESGEPVFISGDTTYDLFGMHYCGGDVEGFLRRRKQQGFNLFRTRLHTSYFHPPFGTFDWQTKRMWPWGGSSTSPRFDLFNLDWFRSVDASVALIEGIGGLGLEMIMEGWGFEFPFNHRTWFTAEWEALWMRYLIARYDAYNCVWFWTPLNEYEYYPNGDWHWTPTADRWALRIGRWIKETAPHGHILSMHNGPRLPPFAERFRADPEAVDAIMFQEWGTRDRDDGWLAAGIEEAIAAAFDGLAGQRGLRRVGLRAQPGLRAEAADPRVLRPQPHPTQRLARRLQRARHHRRLREFLGPVDGPRNTTCRASTDLTRAEPLRARAAVRGAAAGAGAVAGSFAPGHRPLALRGAVRPHARLLPGRRRGDTAAQRSGGVARPAHGRTPAGDGERAAVRRPGRDRRRRASARLRAGGGGGVRT